MAKGENIFKRKDGRWEARYIKGRELSGKIKYGFCFGKTYKEAKEKAEKCWASLIGGAPIPRSDPRHRLAFYCDEWFRSCQSRLKSSTCERYETILENRVYIAHTQSGGGKYQKARRHVPEHRNGSDQRGRKSRPRY